MRLPELYLDEDTQSDALIVIRQQKWGPGELARKIIKLLTAAPGGEMRNRMEFLSAWR